MLIALSYCHRVVNNVRDHVADLCDGPVIQVPAVVPSCDGPAPGSTLWLGVAGPKTFSVDVVSFSVWCDGGGFENRLQ